MPDGLTNTGIQFDNLTTASNELGKALRGIVIAFDLVIKRAELTASSFKTLSDAYLRFQFSQGKLDPNAFFKGYDSSSGKQIIDDLDIIKSALSHMINASESTKDSVESSLFPTNLSVTETIAHIFELIGITNSLLPSTSKSFGGVSSSALMTFGRGGIVTGAILYAMVLLEDFMDEMARADAWYEKLSRKEVNNLIPKQQGTGFSSIQDQIRDKTHEPSLNKLTPKPLWRAQLDKEPPFDSPNNFAPEIVEMGPQISDEQRIIIKLENELEDSKKKSINTGHRYSRNVEEQTETIKELETELDQLNASLEKENNTLKKVESQSGKNTNAYHKQLEKVKELEEQKKQLEANHILYRSDSIWAAPSAISDQQQAKDDRKKVFEDLANAEAEAEFEIAKINAGLIENEYEKRIQLIRINLSQEVNEILKDKSVSPETGERKITAKQNETAKNIKDIRSEQLINDSKQFVSNLSEGVSIAQQIGSIFGFGAHTFASQFLGALQQGLSLASSIISLIANISSMGSAGIFSFLGFASGGVVPGLGNNDTVPAMLTPGEFVISKPNVSRLISSFGNNFLSFLNPGAMLPKIAGSYNSGGFIMPGSSHLNSGIDIKLKPVSIDLRGDKLRIVLDRADKRTGRYKS